MRSKHFDRSTKNRYASEVISVGRKSCCTESVVYVCESSVIFFLVTPPISIDTSGPNIGHGIFIDFLAPGPVSFQWKCIKVI